MDTARAGRATKYVRLARAYVDDEHFTEWSLTQPDSGSIPDELIEKSQKRSTSSLLLSKDKLHAQDTEFVNRMLKTIPPLGWTLDTASTRVIALLSETHAYALTHDCPIDGQTDKRPLCASLRETSLARHTNVPLESNRPES